MSLAGGKEMIELNEADFADASAAMEHWQQFPPSVISHHGEACCQIAREWILAMDYSQLNAGNTLTGPRWLRHRYAWGPSNWPLHWCEAVKRKTLDCGALAALAHEVFTARGVRSYPAQLIQQYSEHATCQWRERWQGEECSAQWIKEDLIYHEGCAVAVKENEIKIWDASAGWWINSKQFGGYGGLLALRVFAPDAESSRIFKWDAHSIAPNRWQKIKRAQSDFAESFRVASAGQGAG